jgi:hypothetical protein
MSNETDPKLRALFAAYAPVLADEPFITRTRAALVQQERRARIRATATYATCVLLGAGIAMVSWALVDGWLSSVNDGLLRWTGTLSPLASQSLAYGLTAVAAVLGRRRIRAFLVPW